MKKWTKAVGYPYISIDKQGDAFKVEQHRFLSSGEKVSEEPWSISLNFLASTGATHTEDVLELSKDVHLPEEATKDASWWKVNSKEAGFFRVNYSPELASGLSEALKAGALSAGRQDGNTERCLCVEYRWYSVHFPGLVLGPGVLQ